jgi:hypothetical protein
MPEFPGTLIPPRLSAAPSSPVTGQIYYHTGAKELRYWDGTAWVTPSTLEIGNAYTEAMAGNMTIAEISSSNVNEDHVWMENFRITGMAAPVDDWDAATKAYVDANAGGGGTMVAGDSPFFTPAGWCNAVGMSGVWRTLSTKSGTSPGVQAPAGSFIENADGSITLVEAGVYTIKATAAFVAAGIQAVSIGTTSDAENYWDKGLDISGGANATQHAAATVKVNAGQKVYVTAFGPSSTAALYYFSIVRESGVKGDKGDVGGTMGACNFQQNPGTGGTTVIAPTPASYVLLPVASTFTADPSSGAFTRNANGSVKVLQTGWYDLAATLGTSGSMSAGGRMIAVLSPDAGTTHYTRHDDQFLAGQFPFFSLSTTVYLTAGTDVGFYIYLPNTLGPAAGFNCMAFSIARSGGPKGDKGDPGGIVSDVPGFEAWLSANSPTKAANALWPIVFPNKSAQSDASFDTSTGRYTVPETGWYTFSGQSVCDANMTFGSGTFWITALLKNGALYREFPIQPHVAGWQYRVGGSLQVYAVQGDYFELGFRYNDSVAHGCQGGSQYTYFTGKKMTGAKGDPGDPQTPVEPNHARYALTVTGTLNAWSTPMLPTKINDSGDVGAFTVINPHPLTGGPAIVVRDYGVYHVSVQTTPPPTAYRHLHQLRANGSFMKQVDTGLTTTAAGVAPTGDSDFDLVMAAGTVLDVVSYTNLAGAVAGHFSITRLVQGQPGPRGDPGPPLPVGGAAGEALIKASASPQDAQWAIPKGSLIYATQVRGASNAMKAILSTQVITIDAAGSIALAISYTPPVDAWMEIVFHCGQMEKTDAAYALGYTQIRCTDADGLLTGVQTESQHSTVQTIITRQITRLLKLNANTNYYADIVFSAAAGTWRYYQGADYLWMTAKVWTR